MKRRSFLPYLTSPWTAAALHGHCFGAPANRSDLLVYGGTAGGIMAAISAARAGASVLVLEPSQHVGGMVTGGLGWTDKGIAESIGGLAAEFYHRIKLHYDNPAAWKYQSRDDYLRQKPHCLMQDKWWYHEPRVASQVFNDMLSEAGVQVLTGQQLTAVDKQGTRITAVRCTQGAVYRARAFIDATYEGDLLAIAGVAYRVGRESTAEYGEEFAGVLPRQIATRKQWDVDVSPYAEDGRLLFGVMDIPRGPDGSADSKVQAYNFRICLTDHPENRLKINQPDSYDPRRYDLLARYIAARGDFQLAQRGRVWGLMKIDGLPNRKTDINDGGPFSTDCIGMNWDYPDADVPTRQAILQDHVDFTKGLLYFAGHDPRVPVQVRQQMLRWGYPKDEYLANGGWSPQLYVREARRMHGAYVMTSHDIETNRIKEDSIGLGSYAADSHLVQRIVDGQYVRNEGNPNDFTPGHKPYEIPYRATLPKQSQCSNLLVTFCVSASHMAFASIRMEPVFMIVSESAALAAVEAIAADVDVQDVPYSRLHAQLLRRQQLLKIDSFKS